MVDSDIPPLPKGAVAIDDDPPLPKGAVPIGGEQTASAPISPSDLARAQSFRSTTIGPPPGGDQATLFNKKSEIETRLRAAGKNPADDPEWQQAARALGGAVTGNAVNAGILGAGAGATGGIAKAVGSVVPKIGRLGEMAVRGTGPALKAVTNIGPVSDNSVLGQKMYSDLKARMDKLLKARSTTEKNLRAEYIADGIRKEAAVAKSYNDYLADMFVANGHPLQQKFIEKSAKNISDHPSIETLVIEKRRLAEIASGEAEGFNAVQKVLAGQMERGLGGIIRKEVPAYGKYADTYGKMSEDINLFEDTALGQRVTKETSEFLPDLPKFDPATLPPKAFSTKHSMAIVKKLSGNNEKLVNSAAAEHVASSLKDLDAGSARAWLFKNREWLSEVPQVKADAEKYVSNLEKVSHTSERARKLLLRGGEGAAAALGAGGGYAGLRHFGLVP